MKLIATPRSHFSRKVRLLLDHLDLPYELVDVGDVSTNNLDYFHGNPAMGVPVLEDGAVWMIESDHIAGYLVRTYESGDRYAVLTENINLLNARAVMNNIMGNEVKLILAKRGGLDPNPHAYFQKAMSAIKQGLAWLETHSGLFCPLDPGYTEFHFISMWDHLELYGLVELPYPGLQELAIVLSQHQKVQKSRPPRD
jgi:glutathione S-transferase